MRVGSPDGTTAATGVLLGFVETIETVSSFDGLLKGLEKKKKDEKIPSNGF